MSDLKEALRGLLVLDLGIGMSPALVTKCLAEAGARVIRLECAAGDPFYGIYPAYRIWHENKEIEKVDSSAAPRVEELLASADICVAGGEDFPGPAWRFDTAEMSARHPSLVILNITGYPQGVPFRDRPASEILAQARSGFCFEHYSDRPYVAGFAAGIYGAAMLGLAALLGAVYAKLCGGTGEVASVSLLEGALSWCLPFWLQAEKPDLRFKFAIPKDPHPLIFRCKDGKFIHFVLGSTGSKGRIYRILKIDDPSVSINDSGFPNPAAPAKYYFGDVDTLATHVAQFTSDELVAAITAAEVAGEHVLPPGACWSDPQVVHNAILRTARGGEVYIGSPLSVDWKAQGEAKRLHAPGIPLGGVRVLDFGALVAGPYGTLPLVDLGADVIKVESPTGDVMRALPRNFLSCNRGKRSIAVDMKTPEGAEIVRRLCRSADVVSNNFRPGVSMRLGMDPESLQELKPGIIVLETTGYGSGGPSGLRPGYDMVLQAFCGFEDLAGGEGNPPLWNRTTMLDFAAGLCGTLGVLLALIHRQRSGTGASVQASLLNAGLFMLSELIKQKDGTGIGARKLNHAQTGFHPAEALYRAADGWIAVYAPDDDSALRLLRALDLEGDAPPRRADWSNAQYTLIGAAIRRYEMEVLCRRFDASGVWAEPVLESGSTWLENADLLANGTIVTGNHPKYGEIKLLGQLFRLASARHLGKAVAPTLGENTREILLELGYSENAVNDFFARKIVA